jgi:hypothetical protein
MSAISEDVELRQATHRGYVLFLELWSRNSNVSERTFDVALAQHLGAMPRSRAICVPCTLGSPLHVR